MSTQHPARPSSLDDFERVYREHAGRVYALALRMTRDAHRAEDLTQEVFIRAWRGRHALRNGLAVGGWLRAIAVNLIVTRNKAHFRRLEREVEAEDCAEIASPPGAPAERRLDLESAIASLPLRARAVLVLHDVEGYTHEEIGKMLGIAAGTSKAQLHRARELLRREVER